MNREQTYSELLISIADYERKIDELKKVNDGLKNNLQGLKEQNVNPDKAKQEKAEQKQDGEVPEVSITKWKSEIKDSIKEGREFKSSLSINLPNIF